MRHSGKAYLLALALLLLPVLQAAGQQIAVKTNVLSLTAGVPEIGFELVTGEKHSLSVSAFGTYNPYWRDKSLGKDVSTSLFAVQPEFRYWFNGRPLTRFYAGANALAAAYGFSFKGELHKGNAAGAGLTVGYVLNLGSRLNLELSSGAGLLFYWGKRYDGSSPLPPEDQMPATKGYKLMPTHLGVTLVYIIK